MGQRMAVRGTGRRAIGCRRGKSTSQQRQRAAAGGSARQGLALAPSFLLIDEIKSGRLVPVLSEFLQTEHAINAIYPHRHHLSAKVRSFIDLLVKHFHDDPGWADPCRSRLSAKPPVG